MSWWRKSLDGRRRQRSTRATVLVLTTTEAGMKLASRSVAALGAAETMPVTALASSRWLFSRRESSLGDRDAPMPPHRRKDGTRSGPSRRFSASAWMGYIGWWLAGPGGGGQML